MARWDITGALVWSVHAALPALSEPPAVIGVEVLPEVPAVRFFLEGRWRAVDVRTFAAAGTRLRAGLAAAAFGYGDGDDPRRVICARPVVSCACDVDIVARPTRRAAPPGAPVEFVAPRI